MLVTTALLMRDTIDLERYLTLSDISSDYNVSSKGGRVQIWEAAIDLTISNPITGVGVYCFPWAHFLAREAAGETYRVYHAVHNSFLQIAVEVGLIGFGMFLLIIVRSVLTFVRINRIESQPLSLPESIEFRALSGFILLGFVGCLVCHPGVD